MLWQPFYAMLQCCISYAVLIIVFKIFNKNDGYDAMVSNGGGVFFILSLFSCLVASARYQLFRRETARNILIDHANNHLLDQNEKIIDQGRQIREANEKLKKLSEYRYNTLNMILYDFRNFTGSIQMSLDLLKNTNENLTPEQNEILGYIGVGNEKLKYLSEKLATSADSDAAQVDYNYDNINLNAEIENTTVNLADAAQMKQISLQLNLYPSPLVVNLDKVFLSQVLARLLSNAIRYSQSGSVLAVHSNKIGDKGVIEVINKGKLIGMEKLNQMFNKLDTLIGSDDTATQSQLGFSIVKKLTEQMGGKISFNSIESTGNYFRIEFNLTK
jgi:signal transduction histidine kinase